MKKLLILILIALALSGKGNDKYLFTDTKTDLNRQLDLKNREIDVIEKLGYMGIGSRTAVDLIDMFKNSRLGSSNYTGGGVGRSNPIQGFGRGNQRIN